MRMRQSFEIKRRFLSVFCIHGDFIGASCPKFLHYIKKQAVPFSPPLLLPQLVIRVHMSDESSKTMMVDERQTVRQVLDSLLDKSHCGYSPDWSLVETITELQMGKGGAPDSFHHT